MNKTPNPRAVAVLCLSALGDFLNALPALSALREKFPMTRLIVVCERPATAQLARTIGVADEVVLLPAGLRRNPIKLARAGLILRRLGAEIAVQTFASHGTCSNLLSLVTGARIRCGFDDGRFRRFLTHKVPLVDGIHYLEFNRLIAEAAIGEPCELPTKRFLPELEKRAERFTPELLAQSHAPYVVFSSGCDPFLAFKRWPLEKWMRLAGKVASRGLKVVFVGDDREKRLLDPYVRGDGESNIVNLCGQTEFADLVSVVGGSEFLVATDGMMLHLCAAMAHPCVGLFGPTDERWGGPWQQLGNVVRPNIPDEPWYRAATVGKAFPSEQPDFMGALDVDTVWKVVEKRLRAGLG